MRVLVTAASKYGAIAEMADAIREALGEAGQDTTVLAADDVTDVGDDAVVIGSAVYAGRWLESAKQFVTSDAAALRAPEGNFWDFEAIRSWARDIAHELRQAGNAS